MHKGEFRDALALRYGWQPPHVPVSCACGHTFSIEHVLSCPTGGFPSIRHNEVRDLTATLLTEVCHNVVIEPDLQPLGGEVLSGGSANIQEGARLDIAANGFWGGRFQKTYFDVRVFNPYAPSNQQSQLSTTYRRHENEKRRAYDQRVREVEHSSFTPLVMSLTGGLGRAATTAYKRLGSLLAENTNQPYGAVMGWLRCKLRFSLLRSSIMCIRGFRSRKSRACHSTPTVDLVSREALIH